MAWLNSTTLNNWLDSRIADQGTNDADAASRNATVITELLDAAQQQIESAISTSKQYSVPLADEEVNAQMRRWQAHLAIYWLMSRRAGEVPSKVEQNYRVAMNELDMVRKGEMILNATDEGAGNAQSVMRYRQLTADEKFGAGLPSTNAFWRHVSSDTN